MSPVANPTRTSICEPDAVCWFASTQVGKDAKMTRARASCASRGTAVSARQGKLVSSGARPHLALSNLAHDERLSDRLEAEDGVAPDVGVSEATHLDLRERQAVPAPHERRARTFERARRAGRRNAVACEREAAEHREGAREGLALRRGARRRAALSVRADPARAASVRSAVPVP